MRRLTDDDVLRLRTAAQYLHRPRRRSAADLVRHLTGVQAQVLSAAGLALRARTEGLTAERVDQSRLADRSIVLTWAMRGTLHLVYAEDYGWLVPLVTDPRVPNAHRRLEQEGVPRRHHDRAVRLVERILGHEGPLTRREVAEGLRARGVRTEGQAIAHLVWLAASEGILCYGPPAGRDQRLVLVAEWLGRPRSMEPDAALAELATRYLSAHGPAELADLAYWSGLRPADARRAWAAISNRLVEVETARGPRWLLRSQKDRAQAGVVRLLPAFDEYLLGWKDREPTAPATDWKKINRGGGWLYPVVLAGGSPVATWSSERVGREVQLHVHPFSGLTATVRRGVMSEARDVERFLGTTVSLVL
jgi:hypothetical protein